MTSKKYFDWHITNMAGAWQAEHVRSGQVIGPCRSREQLQDVIDNIDDEPAEEESEDTPARDEDLA